MNIEARLEDSHNVCFQNSNIHVEDVKGDHLQTWSWERARVWDNI